MNIFSSIQDAIIAAAAFIIGIAVTLLVTAVYWFGVPVLNDYPILLHVPVIGDLAVGHLAKATDKAATDARAGYVKEAQLTAVEARANELERQYKAGQTVIDAYQVQLKAQLAKDAIEDQANDAINRDYEKQLSDAVKKCRAATAADIEFLRR